MSNPNELTECVSSDAPIIEWLADRVDSLVHQIKAEPFWKTATAQDTPEELVQAIMREVYLDIVAYQPHVIEAAIASIAQMPRSMKPKLIRNMLYHQADEWDHGEMALRDYVNMGGDETHARQLPMNPEAFAVAGVWWMITRLRDPFAYIGALYLFEGLTPLVTGLIKGVLSKKGMTESQLEYVEFHSTEDIKHAKLVNHMIAEIVTSYPDALDSVKRGYKYFEAVYPIPLWRAAYQRGLATS